MVSHTRSTPTCIQQAIRRNPMGEFMEGQNSARTLRILSCWINQVPVKHRRFYEKFVQKTDRVMKLLVPMLETSGQTGTFFAQEEALAEHKAYADYIRCLAKNLSKKCRGPNRIEAGFHLLIIGNLLLQLSSNGLHHRVDSFESPKWHNFLLEWAKTAWTGLLPWDDEFPTIKLFMKSRRGQHRIIITLGYTIVVSITLIFMLEPTLRTNFQHGVWAVLSAIFLFNTTTMTTLQNVKYSILGTSLGSILAYFFLSTGISDPIAITFVTCILIFVIGLSATDSEAFFRQSVTGFIVIVFGYHSSFFTPSLAETPEQFAMERMIMVILGVLTVTLWTAFLWFFLPTRAVWKTYLSKIDKSANCTINRTFKFLLEEYVTSDIPSEFGLDSDVEVMDRNARTWMKGEYIKEMSSISHMIVISKQLTEDPSLWRLKELNQRTIEELTTCHVALSYISTWIESYALRSLPFKCKKRNDLLVEALVQEREQLSIALYEIENIDSKNFKYTLRELLEPERRQTIFDFKKFEHVHANFLIQVKEALMCEEDWNESFYTCLIFIDAFYSQILQWWLIVYDLAHNAQLELIDATGDGH
eukprot:TRINITY_DN3259_c0_g1_i9.p1 TRINITY_DN3259_c0_g1~~TRINITY_DN3259_c0_g1_i9.p1  ORF type:complete len:587 (+),score=70.24 TRINITY_DN3259_c0_g1_i9:993-2753(+)